MIEIGSARLGLIEEQRRALVEAFVERVSEIPLKGIASLQLESFKPAGQLLKHNLLLVISSNPLYQILVEEGYDEVSGGEEDKKQDLGILYFVKSRDEFWETIKTYGNGATRVTITLLG